MARSYKARCICPAIIPYLLEKIHLKTNLKSKFSHRELN
jgi:hypothetical protein